MAKEEKPHRHPNRDEKRALKAAQMSQHAKSIGRKAQKRIEPNDRVFSTELDKKLRRMPPEKIDKLLRDDEED
jgi:hypothetical protein